MDNSARSSRTTVSMAGDEFDALLEKGGDGPYPLRHIAQYFFLIGKTIQ